MVRHRGPGRRAALCHCDTGGPGTVTLRAGHAVSREPAMALSRPHHCLVRSQCERVGASCPCVDTDGNAALGDTDGNAALNDHRGIERAPHRSKRLGRGPTEAAPPVAGLRFRPDYGVNQHPMVTAHWSRGYLRANSLSDLDTLRGGGHRRGDNIYSWTLGVARSARRLSRCLCRHCSHRPDHRGACLSRSCVWAALSEVRPGRGSAWKRGHLVGRTLLRAFLQWCFQDGLLARPGYRLRQDLPAP